MRNVIETLTLLALLTLAGACGGGGGGGGTVPGLVEQEPNDDPAAVGLLGTPRVFVARGALSATGAANGLPAGDLDFYRFRAGATGTVTVSCAFPAGTDLDLSLLDGDGLRLATARRDNLDPAHEGREVLYAAVRDGAEYLLEVGGYAGAPAAYEFSFELFPDPRPDPVDPARSKSKALEPLAGARCFHAAARLPGGGAIVGGGTTDAGSPVAAFFGALASTEVLPPGAKRFRAGPGLGATRFGLTGTALADGRVLFAGGAGAGTAALFDPLRDVMESTDLPLADGDRFLHTATALPDGRVLLAGGVRLVLLPSPGTETLATTEVFDPKTGTSAAGPDLAAPRMSHAACLLADGRVLVAGGAGRADCEILDFRGGAASTAPGPALAGVRDDHTLTPLPGGAVLLAGGQGPGGASLTDLAVLDDPADAAFRTLPARLTVARSDHVAVPLPSGQVLLLGGERDPGDDDDEILVSVDLFDPGSETVMPMPPLRAPRDDHRVVRLPDGRLLVTGGEDAGSLSIPDVEAYDPR